MADVDPKKYTERELITLRGQFLAELMNKSIPLEKRKWLEKQIPICNRFLRQPDLLRKLKPEKEKKAKKKPGKKKRRRRRRK